MRGVRKVTSGGSGGRRGGNGEEDDEDGGEEDDGGDGYVVDVPSRHVQTFVGATHGPADKDRRLIVGMFGQVTHHFSEESS